MSTVAAILQQARDATPSHQPIETRKHMSDAWSELSGGKIVPHKWQLDVAESLLLGIDCEIIAATGAGKTLPFVLPLLVRPDMMVVILSPLDALKLDQVCTALRYEHKTDTNTQCCRNTGFVKWACLQKH
jgi:ATP-dependent helicase YprA (DUF1998 family)